MQPLLFLTASGMATEGLPLMEPFRLLRGASEEPSFPVVGLELQGEQGCNGAALVGVQRLSGYPCTPQIWNFILGERMGSHPCHTEKRNSQWDDGGEGQRVPWPILCGE